MTTRQYIGARYVPKFYNNSDNTPEWRPNVVYEALTIVTFNGNSYTSKLYVPANVGNPSDNPQFWAATGNYNAQVEAYRQEVVAVENRIDELEGRNFVLVGDSLAVGVSDGIVPQDAKGWLYYATEIIGSDHVVNASVNGGGFTEPIPYNWLHQLQNADFSTVSKDSITDIVIIGGGNDLDDTVENIASAIAEYVTYCKANFKNLKRIAIGALNNPSNCGNIRERYKLAALNNGCEYISALENLMFDRSLYDGAGTGDTHLSQNGYAQIAPYVVECVLHSMTTYKFTKEVTSNIISNISLWTFDNNDYQPRIVYEISQDENIITLCGNNTATTALLNGWVGASVYPGAPNIAITDNSNTVFIRTSSPESARSSHGLIIDSNGDIFGSFDLAPLGTEGGNKPRFAIRNSCKTGGTYSFVLSDMVMRVSRE